MRKIVLIRHPETTMAGRFCGHSDPDLNGAGEMQLARIVDQVLPLGIDRVVSSDLRRAFRAAQIIGKRIGVELGLRPGLREVHFGLREGLSWNEITERYPHEARAWIAAFPERNAPRGEPYIAFSQRTDAEFNSLLDGRAERVTAVVTHRGPLRYALTKFFGRSEEEAFDQTAGYGVVIVVANVRRAKETLP